MVRTQPKHMRFFLQPDGIRVLFTNHQCLSWTQVVNSPISCRHTAWLTHDACICSRMQACEQCLCCLPSSSGTVLKPLPLAGIERFLSLVLPLVASSQVFAAAPLHCHLEVARQIPNASASASDCNSKIMLISDVAVLQDALMQMASARTARPTLCTQMATHTLGRMRLIHVRAWGCTPLRPGVPTSGFGPQQSAVGRA